MLIFDYTACGRQSFEDGPILELKSPIDAREAGRVLEHNSRQITPQLRHCCLAWWRVLCVWRQKAIRVSSINCIICSMFQNSYQNGTYFDLLDLKTNPDKLKLMYKTVNVPANNKVFDKDLKTFVLEFNAPNSKIHLPKDEKKDLYLIQQYLVLQIYCFPGAPWTLELTISDLTKTKRRVILSPTTHKIEIKSFFVKSPCQSGLEGVWTSLVVDMYSYMEAFKGQNFRSLDSIAICGQFKLKRIYTCVKEPVDGEAESESAQIKQISFLPKNYYFPVGVPHSTHIARFSHDLPENVSEATEHTVKHPTAKTYKPKTGPPLPRTDKNQSVKTEKQIREHDPRYNPSLKKKKDFLANTNGTEVMVRNRKEEHTSDNDFSDGNPSSNFSKNAKSVDKNKKKKQLTKTQEIPPKPRTSLEGYSVPPKKGLSKEPVKNKVNPWRNTKLNGGYTDNSQLQSSKQEDEHNTDTPQTTSMVKTKNFVSRFTDTKNMGFDKRSDHFSENQYIELSQKFSTLTDGKFFKNELANYHHEEEKRNEQDQIEQNIQMETGSVHSLGEKKDRGVVEHEPIKQSICDSLDGLAVKGKAEEKVEQVGRSSLYGFGQQLMRRFMHDIERPYSPPLGERQLTEQSVTEHHEARDEVELIYDPVLNCYYDHKTHTYYQLKN